jgi:5-methyltetrahydrofolate--homocysteine methyltransferase
MVNMKEVIEKAKAEGISASFMLGGAVVTESYAQTLGATFAKDGVAAVKVVDKIIKGL